MPTYVAKPFEAGTPQAEVIGQTMLAFSENLRADAVVPILEKHGLSNIDPDRWYSHQLWMDVLNDMAESLGGEASSAFVAFGKQVVQSAVMPPEIQTIPDALNALHAIHHANLRNVPEAEGYSLEVVGDKHYIVYHNTPNPDDAIYGFLWGLAARFKGPGETFRVHKIDNPDPSRSRSAFEVTWG
jgi:hypothetical protein